MPPGTGAIPKVRALAPSNKQQETRQRQLDSLRRMEDRLKSLAEEEQRAKMAAAKAQDTAATGAAVAVAGMSISKLYFVEFDLVVLMGSCKYG